MGKHFSALIILLSVLFILSACTNSESNGSSNGSEEAPSDAIELTFWHLFSGGDAEFMNEIIDNFNESQSDIYVNSAQQEHSEYYTKLITTLAAGQGPDIAISHTHALPELVTQGLIYELDELAEESGLNWDEFNENILEATIFDGHYYSVPIDTHAQIMFVNNSDLDQAGLLNDDGSINMDETPEGFADFLVTIKEELPDKMTFAQGTQGAGPYRLWWSFYNQLGGDHILSGNLEQSEYDIDLEAAVTAADYVRDLYIEHEVIPLNLENAVSEFESENAVVLPDGVWTTGRLEGSEEIDFTSMPIPNIFDQPAAWGDSHNFVLPYYDDAEEETQRAALEFMDYATDNGIIWAEAGHIPAKTSVVESEEFQELPFRSEYSEVADYVAFEDPSVHARGVQEIIIRHLDQVWNGDRSPEEAFSNIENEVNQLIGG